jgi:hypothetical protein
VISRSLNDNPSIESAKKHSPISEYTVSFQRITNGTLPPKKATILLPNVDEKVLSLSGHQLIEKHVVRRISASIDSFQN